MKNLIDSYLAKFKSDRSLRMRATAFAAVLAVLVCGFTAWGLRQTGIAANEDGVPEGVDLTSKVAELVLQAYDEETGAWADAAAFTDGEEAQLVLTLKDVDAAAVEAAGNEAYIMLPKEASISGYLNEAELADGETTHALTNGAKDAESFGTYTYARDNKSNDYMVLNFEEGALASEAGDEAEAVDAEQSVDVVAAAKVVLGGDAENLIADGEQHEIKVGEAKAQVTLNPVVSEDEVAAEEGVASDAAAASDEAAVATQSDEPVATVEEQIALLADDTSNATVDFQGNITSATMQKLVNGYWTDATNFDDGDQIKVDISYAFDDTNKVVEGTSITYQLPDGVKPNSGLRGKVTGYVNNEYYTDLGDYTIDENGLITITFNKTFHNTEGAFTGTIEFQGTASNDSETTDKEVKFTEDGTGYIINKKKVDEDLTIKKTGSKKSGETAATYTVTVTSKNGTGNDPVKIVDTVYPSGLDLSQVKYENIKVVDNNGKVITVNDSQIKTESGDGYKRLTVTDLPALPAGGSYTITYDIDYGATIGSGEATLNNNVHGYKGNEDKGNSSAYITVAQKMIEKTGNATDNNGAVLWTITVNPNRASEVKGTYDLNDELNGSKIDWSKVEDLKIEVLDGATWTTTTYDSNSDLAKQIMNGKITIEDGKSYTITYKTKVEGSAGETVKQKNEVDITKDGEKWEAEGDVDVTKPDWKVGKQGTGVKEDEGGSTATAGWTSTVNLPLQSDNTTGFGDEGLLFQDWILTNEGTKDSSLHYSTPNIIESSLVVKLDNKTLDKSQYEIVYYDDNKNEITPGSSDPITGFGVKVKGPQTGATMSFSYNTKMYIGSLKDGESLTVKNTSEVNGKTDSATQTYKKKKTLIKNSSGTAFSTPIVDNTGKTTVNYNAIDGKLYYRVVVYPDSITGSTLTDVIPDGLTLKAENVKIQMTTGAHNIYTEFWYNGYHFNLNEVEGQKPTVTVDGQNLTVQFPDISKVSGYQQASDIYPSTTLFDGNLGYVVDYTVDITDEFWDNLQNTTKTYENTAKWNGKSETQETTVERTTPVIAKAGEQEMTSDNKRSNTIRYYVTINAAGATLNDGKEITLTDNLNNNQYGIKLELDLSSVKLYTYDAAKTDDHNLGQQMSQNSYTFKYDNTTNSFTAGIPDATPCVLVYDYTVTDWNGYANEATLINNVTLEGKDKSSGGSETKIQAADSSATVEKANTLKLVKVDSQRYQKVLPNAEFELYAYDASTKTWSRALSNQKLLSNDKGELNFDTEGSGALGLNTNTLYKLVETKAPEGYSLPSTYTPYYFVMLANGTSANTFWTGIGAIYDTDPDTGAQVIGNMNDVTFVEHKGAATIYAPNRYSSIEVEKLWVDEEGKTTAAKADSVQVQLYQQKTKADCYTVTVNTKTGNGTYTSTKTYQVEKGTALNLYYKYGSNGTFSYSASDGSSGTVTGGTYYNYPNQQSALIAFDAVNQDMTVDVTGTNIAGWDGFNWDSILVAEYTEPSSYIGDGDKTKYGLEQTLSSNNSWKVKWSDLPVVDDNGNPYYYTVEEVGTGEQWKVTYNNNGGIQTGVIEVVNHVVRSYELPSTGGSGTFAFTAGGIASLGIAAFYLRRRLSREGRF